MLSLPPAEWNWRNSAGQLKDMAARSLLLKLGQRGWITLPVRRQAPSNRMRTRRIVPQLWDIRPWSLKTRPWRASDVSRTPGRGFYQALKESVSGAVWFIGQIRQLYRLEDQIRLLSPSERYCLRQEQAPPLWEALKKHAEELQPQLLPKSTLGKALNYFLNEYDAWRGYLADGRFEIDTNLVENDIRPTAVGRRRWLFIGHPQAGWRSAVVYSVLISCRRGGLNPQEYLSDVLARLPSTKITQIQDLLPAHGKPPSGNTSRSSDAGALMG